MHSQLEELLIGAGAAVDYFFSKDADFVITDKDRNLTSSDTRSSTPGVPTASKTSGTTDMYLIAKRFAIPVIHLVSFIHLLKKTSSAPVLSTSMPSCSRYRTYELKPPFIKCEDLSQKYRPLICQTDSVKYSISPGTDIFFPSVKHDNKIKSSRIGGYCGNCRTRFNDYHTHLASEKHQSYAQNEDNFKEIDRCIAECTYTSFEDFVTGIKKRHENST